MSSTVNEVSRDDNATREKMLATLKAELGSDVVESVIANDDLWVRVNVSAWKTAGQVCKDKLGCDYFCFLSGLDWKPNPNLGGEKTFGALEGDESDEPSEMTDEMVSGVAGGNSRFQVFARLYSVSSRVGVTLKADLDDATPTVPTWTELYAGADWHEREAWEMYGFNFEGHPGLRHLYLPGEFEGYPLRKDFPLLAREVKPWPGLVDVEALPGEESSDGEPEGGDA